MNESNSNTQPSHAVSQTLTRQNARHMNSRERILAAMNHHEPDGIPVDLGATPSSGISAIAYARLKRHLEIHTGHTRVYDVIQQLAQPEDDLLDRFRIDVVDNGRAFNM